MDPEGGHGYPVVSAPWSRTPLPRVPSPTDPVPPPTTTRVSGALRLLSGVHQASFGFNTDPLLTVRADSGDYCGDNSGDYSGDYNGY